MSRVIFLLEERSLKILLEGLLPRLLPQLSFLCIPHEGKLDLEKSVPKKLRAWREPGVRFVVIRDNDGSDCRALKKKLVDLCQEGRRPDTLVRIACQEIESWYLGEPDALAEAFEKSGLSNLSNKARFRNPDDVQQPSVVLEQLIPEFQKVSGARRMAQFLTEERNRSDSFRSLLSGLRRIIQE